MANPIDLGLLNFLSPVFVFIFVFAVLYALLKKIKIFGESAGLNSLISFVIAMMFLLLPGGQLVVNIFTPWFFFLVMVVMLIFAFFMFMGVNEKTLTDEIAKSPTFIVIFVGFLVIAFLVALTKAYGNFLTVGDGTGHWESVKRTILSTKVLGGILILIIGSYVVRFIGGTQK